MNILSSRVSFLGDNRELTLATVSTDYTFYFTNNGTSNTSANDTETVKYFDNPTLTNNLVIRTDQDVQIVSIDDVTFTEPLTIFANTPCTRTDLIMAKQMVLRCLVANTNVKITISGHKKGMLS